MMRCCKLLLVVIQLEGDWLACQDTHVIVCHRLLFYHQSCISFTT
jgi:hypothetical protein